MSLFLDADSPRSANVMPSKKVYFFIFHSPTLIQSIWASIVDSSEVNFKWNQLIRFYNGEEYREKFLIEMLSMEVEHGESCG